MPSPDKGGSWGVLGGSFDPVHHGHLNLAQEISHKKILAGVLLIPAFKHPFKEQGITASYPNRLAMLDLAVDKLEDLHICEIEKDENLSGYTIDTLHALKKRFPKAAFHFIIGADLVEQLSKWHRAKQLLSETHFLSGARPGSKLSDILGDLRISVELVEINEKNISASDIRERIKNGAKLDEIKTLMPLKVAQYIFDKGLYR
ncbi:MAG: nicotinate (nicotinamide) nucleotide adenylyltransferase [Candidatus Zixiibacteriota bacterium]